MTALRALIVVVVGFIASESAPVQESIDLLMPKVKPQEPDTYLCHVMKIQDAHRYITGFVPHADANIAHHILLFGCSDPGQEEGQVWNCGEMAGKSLKYKIGSVCKSTQQILYAWAMEAPQLTLPKDVAFDVGQETPYKYLVLQVHYHNVSKFKSPENGDDSSGLTLETTRTPAKKEAGVYLLGTGGSIPPHSIEYMESACDFNDDTEIHPFAFRTHAHALGRVVSGYRIRDGEWTEIGRKDPRLPEMFYNVTNTGMTVRKGDILAARCTMENTKDNAVHVGATYNDEMCNFYLMYSVERGRKPAQFSCFTPGPPMWSWKDFGNSINLDGVPVTASIIPGSDKPLIRNATESNGFINAGFKNDDSEGRGEALQREFQDFIAEQIVDQAISEMSPEALLSLLQQLRVEENEQEARAQAWEELQRRRQQEMLEREQLLQQWVPQQQQQQQQQQERGFGFQNGPTIYENPY